jgi:hypothetical protein
VKNAVSASTAFKIPVSDRCLVVAILMMKARVRIPAPTGRGAPAPGSDPDAPADIQLALRLKVVNKRITEAEHLIAHQRAVAVERAQDAARAFFQTVQKTERNPRSILLLIGNSYDALTQRRAAPFADDCGRREGSMHTWRRSSQRCTGSASRIRRPAERLRGTAHVTCDELHQQHRPAPRLDADEEHGLVFGLTISRHPMNEVDYGADRRHDGRAADAQRAVRARSRAHLQDLGRQDSRDRSDGLHAAAVLEERMESIH